MAALLRAARASRTVSSAMTQTRGYKVAVLGAAGGIGQPCGLLMKMVRAPIASIKPRSIDRSIDPDWFPYEPVRVVNAVP
eukprot:29939-Pelagococcus_subviridis.AAC.2